MPLLKHTRNKNVSRTCYLSATVHPTSFHFRSKLRPKLMVCIAAYGQAALLEHIIAYYEIACRRSRIYPSVFSSEFP